MPDRPLGLPAGLSATTLAFALTALPASSPAAGSTACYDQSCSTACVPPSPSAVSVLIGPDQLPSGVGIPLAFVDPGDGKGLRWIATLSGAVLAWDGATRTLLPTPFLDLRAESGGPVGSGGERGLVALAADPDYSDDGYLYVMYTRRDLGAGTLGDVVIERYQRSATDPRVADPLSATAILVMEHSSSSHHNGGWLAFGPDGYLYVSTGDATDWCDGGLGASGNSQRSDVLAGKILRLDVRGVDAAGGQPDDCGVGTGLYTVPSTNPFFGQEPACDEVWALGLRNPFRFSFDRSTGDLYLGDVGQFAWEEINLKPATTPAPVNFGWACREGCESAGNPESQCSTAGCPEDPGTVCQFPRSSGFLDPVLCHHNPGWHSAIGGYRYRGTRVPSIAGDYFYADASCGQIWKTTTLDPADPAAIASACWSSGHFGTYGFAEDRLGELYIVVGAGRRILCVHDGEGCFWAGWGIFADGFESGEPGRWSESEP